MKAGTSKINQTTVLKLQISRTQFLTNTYFLRKVIVRTRVSQKEQSAAPTLRVQTCLRSKNSLRDDETHMFNQTTNISNNIDFMNNSFGNHSGNKKT